MQFEIDVYNKIDRFLDSIDWLWEDKPLDPRETYDLVAIILEKLNDRMEKLNKNN